MNAIYVLVLCIVLTKTTFFLIESKQPASTEQNNELILNVAAKNDGKEPQKEPKKVLFLFFHDKGSHFASMKPLMHR